MKNKEISNRITQIREHFCKNDNKVFAQMLGIKSQQSSQICSGTTTIGSKMINRVLSTFPSVSKSWLILGTGSMLDKEELCNVDVEAIVHRNPNDRSDIKLRMLEVIKMKRMSMTTFATTIATNRQNFDENHIYNAPSADMMVKFLTLFPEIDANWLLLGQGYMMRSSLPADVDIMMQKKDIEIQTLKECIRDMHAQMLSSQKKDEKESILPSSVEE